MKNQEPPSVLASLMALSGMGFTVAIPIVIGAIAGNYLDGLLNTKPLLLFIGLLLGLISGIYGAYRLFKSVLYKR